jgi:predicted RecA/RadA family phage recombinase
MKNFVGSGDRLTLTAPVGGVTGGVGYIIGAIFCVAQASVPAGQPFAAIRRGIINLPKPAGAIAEGARLWWNNTTKLVATASAAGLFPIGCAVAAAPANATIVEVVLDEIATIAAP